MSKFQLYKQYYLMSKYFNRPIDIEFLKIINVPTPKNIQNKIPQHYKITYQNKMQFAQKYLRYLAIFPYIKMIGISGSVASKTPLDTDDIDVFIVTQGNALWLARLTDWVIYSILGIRRLPHTKNLQNKLCFNYYITKNNLKISPQNIFTAYQLMTTKVIYGEKIYQRLLMQNKWLQRFTGIQDISMLTERLLQYNDCTYKPSYRLPSIRIMISISNSIAKLIQTNKMKKNPPNTYKYTNHCICTFSQALNSKVIEHIKKHINSIH